MKHYILLGIALATIGCKEPAPTPAPAPAAQGDLPADTTAVDAPAAPSADSTPTS